MCAVSIGSVVGRDVKIELSKIFLIYPLISHSGLLSYLSRKNIYIRSVEELIALKMPFLSNFNQRYEDSLLLTVNSLQLLSDMGYLTIVDGLVSSNTKMTYDISMGKRAKKIFDASENILKILEADSSSLYLNLRVKL
ncbi:MAG TPA: hypothetical protein DCM28_01930 [Phycisphaerales bacterium]|nr:hypothetical protein [Phycisphaerales bacterium]|tara:strand:- start:1515 stop:1928 length:414 start_codon:yes stop_codon:yes gene_type:complete